MNISKNVDNYDSSMQITNLKINFIRNQAKIMLSKYSELERFRFLFAKMNIIDVMVALIV